MAENTWTFDPHHNDWKYGTPENGAGVHHDRDGLWYFNVVIGGDLKIVGGKCDSREEAQDEALEEFNSLKSALV